MSLAGGKKRRVLAAALLSVLLSPGPAWAKGGPDIYFYPPPLVLQDGSLLASPVTVDADQITRRFPAVSEMAGVSLIVYWSKLCPTETTCDLSLIDDVLNYWHARGKKVVLGVATIGYPVKSFRNGVTGFVNATPDWVLRDSGTYIWHVPTLGAIGLPHRVDTPYPDFWTAPFLHDLAGLVAHLKSLDGNPALAQIRISTGLMSEDNPIVGYLNRPMAGYDETEWLTFCRAAAALYEGSFRKTQLEFDIGRLAFVYPRQPASFRRGLDVFVDDLFRRRVFLSYNGLRSTNLDELHAADADGPAYALHQVSRFARAGIGGGLEGAPLTVPIAADVKVIAALVAEMHVGRLTLWGTEAGFLNYARFGPNALNAPVLRLIPLARWPDMVAKIRTLFALLGEKGAG